MNKKCEYFRLKAEYNRSLEQGRASLAIYRENDLEGSEFHAEACFLVSVPLLFLGDYREANRYNMESLEIRRKIFGDDNYFVYQNYSLIPEYYKLTDNWEKSEESFDLSIQKYENSINPDHPELLTIKFNYSTLLAMEGKYVQAREILYEILSPLEKERSSYNSELIEVYKSLAVVHQILEESDEAELYFKKALELCTMSIGTESSRYISLLAEFATFLQEKGKIEESENILVRSIELLKRDPDSNFSGLYTAVSYLTDLYMSQEKYIESLYYLKPLYDRNRGTVDEKKMLSDICINISKCYYRTNLIGLSERFALEALEFVKDIGSAADFIRVDAFLNLGIIYIYREKYDDAISVLSKIVKIYDQIEIELDREKPVGYYQYLLATVYRSKREYDMALKELESIYFSDYIKNLNLFSDVVEQILEINRILGLEEKSISYIDEIIEKINDDHDDESLLFSIFLLDLQSDLYIEMGDIQSAVKSNERAMKLYQSIHEKNEVIYYTISNKHKILKIEDHSYNPALIDSEVSRKLNDDDGFIEEDDIRDDILH